MAISKTQNERPAIIELIDGCNELQTVTDSHTTSIGELSLGLGSETDARILADEQLGLDIAAEENARINAIDDVQDSIDAEVENRSTADSNIQGQIGTGFSSTNTIAQAITNANNGILSTNTELGNFIDKFRFEVTEELEIVAERTTQVTVAFSTPYEVGSQVAAFPAFIYSSAQGVFEVNAYSITNEGLSLDIYNSGSSDGSVIIGILAVRMN